MFSTLSILMFFRKTKPIVHNPEDRTDQAKLNQWRHMVDTFVDDSSLSASDKEHFRLLSETYVVEAPRGS